MSEASGLQDGTYEVNGKTIIDILDYRFEETGEELSLTVRHPDDTVSDYVVEKDEDEELGLVYAESLMDDYRSCRNRCIFCFIDQMPKGMNPETITEAEVREIMAKSEPNKPGKFTFRKKSVK